TLQWPDKLLDPEPYLQGDIFDAVMNYRWYRAVRHFFNASPDVITASELVDSLNRFRSNLRPANNYAMMNYTGGFDTPRILTSLFNKNKYKYHCKVHENPDYKIHKPDAETHQTLKLLLAQQYAYVGAPHIYFGDEMGMWGADDPSCRKPLLWTDYRFEDELVHPLGQERPVDPVAFNREVFECHQQLIKLRKSNPVLIHGDIEFLKPDEAGEALAFRRFDDTDEIIAVFNTRQAPMKITLPISTSQSYEVIWQEATLSGTASQLSVELPARAACWLRRK
ncbi:MAG: alpha-glucosidase C-terminal domain-containing protein, partial [Bacteroidota bacterium]